MAANERYQEEVVQRLSSGLAAHIAGSRPLMDADGWKPESVRTLLDQLMAVNPAVEVYLIGNDGRIEDEAAPAGHAKLDRVDVDPGRRFPAAHGLQYPGGVPPGAGHAHVVDTWAVEPT